MNEILSGNQNNKSTNKSQMVSKMSGIKSYVQEKSSSQVELIDEHLFVEALALCSLYDLDQKESDIDAGVYMTGDEEDEPFAKVDVDEDLSEESPVEKVLSIIERIANSDGVFKQFKKGNTFKCNLMDKKDMLEPFRAKYSWYFKKLYYEEPKKQGFDDVLEMSGWTNASRIE